MNVWEVVAVFCAGFLGSWAGTWFSTLPPRPDDEQKRDRS